MNVEVVKIKDIKMNPNNPRVIKDEKFEKLCNSIRKFPRMLELRPIVVNDDMIVLGGNMRLKALKEIGLTEAPIIKASNLTEEEQRQFIIKDNVGFGEWDWEMLANEWDSSDLLEWGLDTWNPEQGDLEDFFVDEEVKEEEKKNTIVLEYTEEDHEIILEAFSKQKGSKEEIVWRLLGCE